MTKDPAQKRLMAIHAVRWSGLALVIFGALIIGGRIGLPEEAGYVLFFVGLVDTLFMPAVLARRWKSPPP